MNKLNTPITELSREDRQLWLVGLLSGLCFGLAGAMLFVVLR